MMRAHNRAILILTPPLLLVSTAAAFLVATFWLGEVLGYFLGFLFYWGVWCTLLPLALLGRRGMVDLFRSPRSVFGRPWWIGALALGLPLVLGYGYAFPRAFAGASVSVLAGSAALAVVNGTLEEVLWRGTYVRMFPNSWGWGYLYPAVGFGMWHVAPQLVFPNQAPGGRASLVAVAIVLGLLWGWVATRTGSIRWTAFSHVLFNFAGLGARLYVG